MPNLVDKLLRGFKIRLLAEIRREFLLLDGKVDSKQLGKRLCGSDGGNCNRPSGSVNLRVFRRNRACSREGSEGARSDCEDQRSEKFLGKDGCLKARIELRLGFAKG